MHHKHYEKQILDKVIADLKKRLMVTILIMGDHSVYTTSNQYDVYRENINRWMELIDPPRHGDIVNALNETLPFSRSNLLKLVVDIGIDSMYSDHDERAFDLVSDWCGTHNHNGEFARAHEIMREILSSASLG